MSINTLSFDSLFDTDDLFGSAALYEQTLTATVAPKADKVRIRAYSDDYYKWLSHDMPAPVKTPQILSVEQIVATAKGKPCKRCDETGTFVLDSGKKTICYQCAGSGRITAIDEARTAKYWERKNSGATMDKHHSQYARS